jgi:hypothetical protein
MQQTKDGYGNGPSVNWGILLLFKEASYEKRVSCIKDMLACSYESEKPAQYDNGESVYVFRYEEPASPSVNVIIHATAFGIDEQKFPVLIRDQAVSFEFVQSRRKDGEIETIVVRPCYMNTKSCTFRDKNGNRTVWPVN